MLGWRMLCATAAPSRSAYVRLSLMSDQLQYLDRVRDKTRPDSLGVAASEPIVKDDVERIQVRWDSVDRVSGWVPVEDLTLVGRAVESDAYESVSRVCRRFRAFTNAKDALSVASALVSLAEAVGDLELWLRKEDRS